MFNKNLLETMSDIEVEQLVYDHIEWAVSELGNSDVNSYIKFFLDLANESFLKLNKEEKTKLKKYIVDYYNSNITEGIIDSKIIITDELKRFIEEHSYLLETNIQMLIDKANRRIKDELLCVLKQSGIEVN